MIIGGILFGDMHNWIPLLHAFEVTTLTAKPKQFIYLNYMHVTYICVAVRSINEKLFNTHLHLTPPCECTPFEDGMTW